MTALTVVSGAIDIAGQVLFTSGLHAVWRLAATWWSKSLSRDCKAGGTPTPQRGIGIGPKSAAPRIGHQVVALAAAWILGFVLAAPHLLPLAAYLRTGSRMLDRAGGSAERPPIGAEALPQTFLPNFYGAHGPDSLYLVAGNQLESTASAYAGLLAAFVLAPLAWLSPKQRSWNAFWLVMGLVGLSWPLDVPGLVTIWRLPGLNMMSWNRFAFVTAFATLSLAVVGLEQLWQRWPGRRMWFLGPALTSAFLAAWCSCRAANLPEPIATKIGRAVDAGQAVGRIVDKAGVQRVRRSFTQTYLEGAAWCTVACAGWLLIATRQGPPRWFRTVLVSLLLCELLRFADGFNPQCDSKLYYPTIPVLQQLTEAPPGRVLGVGCLPAMLNEIYRLRDVRGYDSVDPRRIVELLRAVAHPAVRLPNYARLQAYVPRFQTAREDGKIRAPGILDMLGVRYFIFRGTPPPQARTLMQQDDYWVVENERALPRAFVPRRVEALADEGLALERMAADDFDPRRLAYVAERLELPDDCQGTAEVVDEVPCAVAVQAEMRTAGLLVLADQWYEGWRAELNGHDAPIVRVNHAMRGVVLPAGKSRVDFRYEPPGFRVGLWLALGAVSLLAAWIV
ncbi:MAG TPA: YfhO family protein, partial [Pirellulales bacterium]|nr:YfhO family protein [Pirellulales bacterium]